MQVEVLNTKGQKTGRSVDLPEDIFGVEPNNHVIYLAVKQYLAAQRQGTHKVKTRAEVQGASKKLHKQKGTGGSRKGNIRNPLYKGGGTVFGPKPHSYDFKLNKKVKDLAKVSALSHKTKNNALVVVEDFNDNLFLSLRNISKVESRVLADLNTYDIVNADVLVLTENSAKIFTEE